MIYEINVLNKKDQKILHQMKMQVMWIVQKSKKTPKVVMRHRQKTLRPYFNPPLQNGQTKRVSV